MAEKRPATAKKATAKKPASRTPTLSKLIDEAGAARASTLDLAGLLDRTLPEGLLRLTGLRELDLSHNPRLDLDLAFRTLSALPELRHVRFHECGAKVLPESLADLASLEEVSLRTSILSRTANHLDLAQAVPILARLPRLRVLDASVQHTSAELAPLLRSMPALETLSLASVVRGPGRLGASGALVGPPTLRSLDLSHLDIRDLPSTDPRSFPMLERLVLRDAIFATPPGGPSGEELVRALVRWAAHLPRLTALDLRVRAQHALPAELGALNLEELWIDAARYDGALPEVVTELVSLRALHVANLRDAPEHLGRLQALEVLDFDVEPDTQAQFAALPQAIADLPHLSTLRLGRAPMTSWPDLRATKLTTLTFEGASPACLSELRSLRVASGDVHALAALPHLEHIDLSEATTLPEALRTHPSIRSVRCWRGNTPLDDALDVVADLPALQALDLRGTLPSEPRWAPTLRRLRVATEALDLEGLLPRLPPLTFLRLEVRRGVEIPSNIGALASLVELELTCPSHPIEGRDLSSLSALPKLRRLLLAGLVMRAPKLAALRAHLPTVHVCVSP